MEKTLFQSIDALDSGLWTLDSGLWTLVDKATMASAEGRARWLHYANHCIIQEDYKEASGPGSLPPSSSKSRSEEGPGDGAKSYDFLDDRTADLNDLASFVSDKSVENFDNSNLPRPQINKSGQWFVPDKGLASLDQVSNFADSMQRSPTSVGISQSHSPSGAIGCPRYGLDVPLSSTTPGEAENMQASSELSKAQLLEALSHSQTRARQAEETAKKAYDEKEHLITHFLKQASQLFAYG
ncbi:hypothetical protein L6452_14925 [Arctium lappa]|uniref:Uncharacterized protein n=1 Tax=Arctium lappa TaxID=4217 RepID=A0ACB9CM77_ARCLA|nr:hypothetical protein L6452_14925 [Arctium lappa]